ncbi:MAG: hypothetical protein WC356_04620 [Candidatus Micrarchaeia archaeon]|jgi:hypothetical protein
MYFKVTIKEQNGEREYYHDCITEAKSFNEALIKVENTARNWYEDVDDEDVEVSTDEVGNNTYDFIYIGASIRVDSVCPTTIKEWCKQAFQAALI